MASKRGDGEDMAEIAGKMWEFLDKLAANDPAEYKKFIDQQMEDGKQMFTPPEPAYCLYCRVKAWEETTCSLYINVCQWSNIPMPKADQDPIPVQGGTLRYLVDEKTKRKTPSKDLVYDVAFNPSVIEECSRGPVMDTMLVALVLDYVEDRTELKVLDKAKFKKLKALHKGPKSDLHPSLDQHWSHLLTPETKLDIRHSLIKQLHTLKKEEPTDSSPLPPLILKSDKTTKLSPSDVSSAEKDKKSKPLIEEISSEQVASCDDLSANGGKVLCVPAHSVTVSEPDGKNPRHRVVVKVSLPGVTSANEVDLEVAKTDLQLVVKDKYHLSLQLPTPVDDDSVRAKFASKNSTLTITLPCS